MELVIRIILAIRTRENIHPKIFQFTLITDALASANISNEYLNRAYFNRMIYKPTIGQMSIVTINNCIVVGGAMRTCGLNVAIQQICFVAKTAQFLEEKRHNLLKGYHFRL